MAARVPHRVRDDAPFVDVDLARDALKAGKSINFLRRRCGDDAAWAAEQAPVLVAAENAGGLRYGNARALRALVTEAKRRIDRCLRRSLFDTYGLYDHVFAAKRYLLMGQGDFHARAHGRRGRGPGRARRWSLRVRADGRARDGDARLQRAVRPARDSG